MKPASRLAAALFAACLALPRLALAQDAEALADQGMAAYQAKRYAESAELYVRAAKLDTDLNARINDHYNAACAYALAGNADAAFANLRISEELGLASDVETDPDFDSLHADPRWAALVAERNARHPTLAAGKVQLDWKLTNEQRYFAGRKAIAAGLPTDDKYSSFNQHYPNQAQAVGEYDEASRIYGFTRPKLADPVAAGFVHAVDAVPVVLEQARGRQAVFLNESHGQSQTRAANYALLAGLRAQGFDVLALETLSAMPVAKTDGPGCANSTLGAPALPARGYPFVMEGAYFADPVFAEIVREALRLRFRLVAYESQANEGGQARREQDQAENLACLFKQDPKTRLVAIAGFSHINEGKDSVIPGGMMAYRFRQLSGIDPLTVDTTTQLDLDAASLDIAPDQAGRVSYALLDTKGLPFGTPNHDLVLHVPGPSHRNDGQPSWLALGGSRKPTPVGSEVCAGKDPCLLDARHGGEAPEAVADDRCIVAGGAKGCTLYLRPGSYELSGYDDSGQATGKQALSVKR